jgi:hypothetical protein
MDLARYVAEALVVLPERIPPKGVPIGERDRGRSGANLAGANPTGVKDTFLTL